MGLLHFVPLVHLNIKAFASTAVMGVQCSGLDSPLFCLLSMTVLSVMYYAALLLFMIWPLSCPAGFWNGSSFVLMAQQFAIGEANCWLFFYGLAELSGMKSFNREW
ncbi:hypothetical protein U1Q18_030138 [Sarracenia purpurea var. burkii]